MSKLETNYQIVKNWITICRINNISYIAIIINLIFYLFLWALIPIENKKFLRLRRCLPYFYPQIQIDKPKCLDPLRIIIQSIVIALFRINPQEEKNGFVNKWKIFMTFVSEHVFKTLVNLTSEILKLTFGKFIHTKIAQKKNYSSLESIAKEKNHLTMNIIVTIIMLALTLLFVTQPLNLTYQFVFMILMWVIALLLNQVKNRISLIMMIFISIMISSRYIWWRCTNTIVLEEPLSGFLSILLLSAELYSFVVMVLSYIQVSWVLEREPYPLPDDTSTWPTVDIMIPTYNEPMEVIKPCLLAALDLDWPQDKLRIHLLDDGSRPEFENYAKSIGVNYIKRIKHDHAKAGNINHALTVTDGELIAIFDCDHIPTRAFLQMTVGWMVYDKNISLVQTPHHFYSEDPFEKNLGIKGKIPAENSLFHDFIQKGNDMWNSTMFCGSCAVIRRKPLVQIGGIAQETVTEDAHTSLRLNGLGYSSAFIGIPLAAGLSTESLGDHINQRIRWARGMVQIFRIDNPFFKKGLKLPQRLCFANAMIHFLHGIPRIIFLLAPLPYLFFNIYVIFASGISILAYVLPYMVHTTMTNSRIQGKKRFFFWGAIYETILSWYITLPTLIALISPKHGKFNVTAKGASNQTTYFDWSVSKVYIILILLNLLGFLVGLYHVFTTKGEVVTILVNMGWVLYNMLILGASAAVALEKKQVRSVPRVYAQIPATVELPNGEIVVATITDFSQNGLGLKMPELGSSQSWSSRIDKTSTIYVNISQNQITYRFSCKIQRINANNIGLEVILNNLKENIEFIRCTFATADRWLHDEDNLEKDSLFNGIHMLFNLGLNGYKSMLSHSPIVIRWIFEIILKISMLIFSLLPEPIDKNTLKKLLMENKKNKTTGTR